MPVKGCAVPEYGDTETVQDEEETKVTDLLLWSRDDGTAGYDA
jgi:hypothetical protein